MRWLLALLLAVALPAEALEPRLSFLAGDPLELRLGLEAPDVFRLELGAGWSPSDRRGGLATVDALVIWPGMAGVLLRGRVDGRIGLGARLAAAPSDAHDPRFGLRAPAELAWLSLDGPLEVFFEVAPGLELEPKRVRMTLEGGVGLSLRF